MGKNVLEFAGEERVGLCMSCCCVEGRRVDRESGKREDAWYIFRDLNEVTLE